MPGHSERARRALAHLPESDPALAALALWCRHRDGPGASTATQDQTILYGASFPTLPLPEQIGLAGHHILHVALRHGPRATEMRGRHGARFDPTLYALAADALVNETLLRAGHALPRPCVRLTELLAETVPDGAGAGDDALGRWDADRLYVALTETRAGQGGEATAAEAARSYARRRGFEGDLLPAPTEAPGREAAADWQGRLAQAVATGQQAGRGIGRFAALLADMPLSQVPWEVRLRGLLARAVDDRPRRSHRRPARQWLARDAMARGQGALQPVYEPGLERQNRRARIAVGYDTSGSIGEATFARFAAEVVGLARRTGAEVHLLAFDEEVHEARQLAPGATLDPPAASPKRRGGGTSFVDVIAEAGRREVSALVVLTDLDGRFPSPPRRLPVIWAVPGAAPSPPPFGMVLDIGR